MHPLSAEFQLVLFLCQKYLDPKSFEYEHASEFILNTRFDWDRFCYLVNQHRVISIIHESISTLRELIPKHVLQTLELQRRNVVLRNLNNLREIKNIQDAFGHNCIDVVFLKGLIYSHELYGDATFRHSKDIDLIVRETDLEKAVQVMIDIGFSLNEKSIPKPELRKFQKHLTFTKTEGGICVELHWRIYADDGSGSLNGNAGILDIFPNSQIVSISGINIKTLPLNDQIIHFLRHGINHEWSRLLRIMDFVMMLRQFKEDSHRLEQIVKNNHLIFSYCLAFQLAKMALQNNDDKLDAILQPNIRVKACSKLIYNNEFEIGVAKAEASFTNKFKNRIARTFVRLCILSETRKMKAFFQRNFVCPNDYNLIPLPPKLHFLYILLHPFCFIYRHINTNK